MKWKMLMKEVLISRIGNVANITPTDMDGTTHCSTAPSPDIDAVLVYYGATTALIKDGSICIRGNRLVVDVDVEIGHQKCLVVKVADTSGEE